VNAGHEKIGFVGLGHMGGNMASRYLSAGYSVYGEARSREGLEHLLDEGLRWCDTPREVAQSADVVITSIPNDDVLREIASGTTESRPVSRMARSGST
jgi:3-hydroxyisobutyrate dehydrogenase-like beta-hydroxyacid dehydrogenase